MSHGARHRLTAAAAAALALLAGSQRAARADGADAASAQAWSARFGAVTGDHYAVQPDGDEFYAEEYELRAWGPEGASFAVSFVVGNLGFGDNKLVVQATARPPGEGGRKVEAEAKFDDDDWSHGRAPFRITAGATTLTGGPGRLTATVRVGAISADVVFDNELPPWRPGGGRVTYGDAAKFYDVTWLAPRARVGGTVQVDGKAFTLSGATGWADHRVSNAAPHVAGRRWLTWRSFDGDWTILAQDVVFPPDLGGRAARYLLVGHKGTVVFESVRFGLKHGSLARDPESALGYRYPQELSIDAKAGDRTLRLRAKGKLARRKDLLDGAGAARGLVARFVSPVGYYFDAEYSLEITLADGTQYSHQGRGDYVFKQVNP